MTSIFQDITPTQSEVDSVQSSTHWEADVEPDEPSGPLTDADRSALDSRTDTRDTSPFADIDMSTDRLEYAQGEYIPPKVRQQRKQAAMLPRTDTIKALEDALHEVARHEMPPKELADAVTKARQACQKAYAVLDDARHPEAPRKARNASAKQAAVEAIEAAKAAVHHAVRTSERDDIRQGQYEAIVSGIAEAKTAAAETTEVAAAEFARWRALIAAGDDLAKVIGVFGPDWHRHKDERSINPRGLVGDLRRARDLARTDDVYLSGRYLVEDSTPDGQVPAWTKEALASGGEFERTVLWRLEKQHPNDPSAADSMTQKSLRPILNAPIPALHPEAQRWGDSFGPHADND